MDDVLRIIAVILLAVAMSAALAHALELPGKMRLTKEAYDSVQPIYYPGFTIAGGIGEAGGLVLTAILLFRASLGTPEFWLTLVALLGLGTMQAVYWLFTHPGKQLLACGYGSGPVQLRLLLLRHRGARRYAGGRPPDWKELRDRWEYSHVVRAALSAIGFVALVISLAQ